MQKTKQDHLTEGELYRIARSISESGLDVLKKALEKDPLLLHKSAKDGISMAHWLAFLGDNKTRLWMSEQEDVLLITDFNNIAAVHTLAEIGSEEVCMNIVKHRRVLDMRKSDGISVAEIIYGRGTEKLRGILEGYGYRFAVDKTRKTGMLRTAEAT